VIRTLSIALDDEAKTIAVGGREQFTLIELLGIAEHIKIMSWHYDATILHEAQNEGEVTNDLQSDAQKESLTSEE
jgi:hypothetical protein